MFVKPRPALENGAIKSAAGPFLMVAGVIVFVHLVQHYVKHMTPIVNAEQNRQEIMGHRMDGYYEGPSGSDEVHIADMRTTNAARSVIGREVDAVSSGHTSEALALASSSYQGSSPIIYTAAMKLQFPQLFYNTKHLFGPAIVVNGGSSLIQQVTSFTSPNVAWNYTCTLVHQSNSWKIQTIEFEGYSAVGLPYTGFNDSVRAFATAPQEYAGRF